MSPPASACMRSKLREIQLDLIAANQSFNSLGGRLSLQLIDQLQAIYCASDTMFMSCTLLSIWQTQSSIPSHRYDIMTNSITQSSIYWRVAFVRDSLLDSCILTKLIVIITSML